jgi:23S rRNA (uracil1939-C5)-methyltransferase
VTPDAPAPTTSPAEVANQPKGDPSTRPPRPERGDEVQLRIDSLAFGGAGVARYGDGHGWVVFVRDALPGDTVRAQITKRKRHYGEARVVEIVTPSPDRVAPLADHPGAPWQVIPYEQQLEIKSRQVDDALRRLGHLDGFELLPRARLVGGHRPCRGLHAAVRARQPGATRRAGVGARGGLHGV